MVALRRKRAAEHKGLMLYQSNVDVALFLTRFDLQDVRLASLTGISVVSDGERISRKDVAHESIHATGRCLTAIIRNIRVRFRSAHKIFAGRQSGDAIHPAIIRMHPQQRARIEASDKTTAAFSLLTSDGHHHVDGRV